MDEQEIGALEELAIPYLRSQLPATVGACSDDELRQRVRSSVERGQAYGFETEQQILDLTTAGCLLGENFESDPENEWAADVLNDEDTSPDERAALLAAIASIIVEEREGE